VANTSTDRQRARQLHPDPGTGVSGAVDAATPEDDREALLVNAADQVITALEFTLTLAPLAVYFLGLGLVNSQAQPCLVRARTDFAVLAVVLVPVVIGPLASLIEQGHVGWAAGGAVLVTALLLAMLPGRRAGWVIYNVELDQCRRLLIRAARRIGADGQIDGDQFRMPDAGFAMTLGGIPWLRNVTLHQRSVPSGHRGSRIERQLIDAIGQELRQERMLPSPVGASLVVIGAALLVAPLWCLCHNADAIVDVVRQLLLA